VSASPTPPDVPGEVSLGASLARLRREAGLTGKELGRRAGMSQAKVSRIETGVGSVDPKDVSALAGALGLSEDEQLHLTEQAERGRDQVTDWRPTRLGAADRQRDFAQLEAATREFRVYQPAVVVGLLQTSEYARSVLSQFQALTSAKIADSPVDVSEAVSARVRRHQVLADKNRHFTFIMSEAVLSNRLCRPADMLAQIERIREVAAESNVTVSIVPADARWKIPPYHGFEMLDDRCVLIDLINTTLISRVRADIRLYGEVFATLEELGTTDIGPLLDQYYDFYLEESGRDHGRG